MESQRQPANRDASVALAPAPEGRPDMKTTLESRFATAMGENVAWFDAHHRELWTCHPDWHGKDLAIAACTSSKVLAVGTTRAEVLDASVRTPELLQCAQKEGVPPSILVTAVVLTDE